MDVECFRSVLKIFPLPALLLRTGGGRVEILTSTADDLCRRITPDGEKGIPAWLREPLAAFLEEGEAERVLRRTVRVDDGQVTLRVWLRRLPPPDLECVLVFLQELDRSWLSEEELREMVRGVSVATGDTFFRTMVLHLVRALGADHAFICEFCGEDRQSAHTVALCIDGRIVENVSFMLAGTPCERVVQDGVQCFPDRLQEEFPQELRAKELGVEAYYGIPLVGSDGTVLGLMAVMGRHPLKDGEMIVAMLQVFAARAASELEHKYAVQSRQEQVHFLQSLLDALPNPVFFKDLQGTYLGCNVSMCTMLGKDKDEIVGRNVFDIAPLSRACICSEEDRAVFRTKGPRTYEAPVVYADGSHHVVVFNKAPFFTRNGEAAGLVGIIHDITERKKAEERIQQLAYYDILTGLPNRTLLRDRIGQTIRTCERTGGRFTLLFLDLDRFKGVNDSFGHRAGDQLLRSVAARLTGLIRRSDTLARLGGDEFVAVLHDVQDEEGAATVAQKILHILSEPFILGPNEVFTSVSIGIALFPAHGRDLDILLKNADIAMYRAKEQGRNGFEFFSEEMTRQAMDRMSMETKLRRALERQEFFLEFQPQVDVQAGRVIGMEALIRWQQPELGTVPPDRFIPLAEETGLILPIGEWVLARACEEARRWQREGAPAVGVAVNLSGRQFRDPRLVETIAAILEETELPPHLLELELTESILMEAPQSARSVLCRLKEMGVRLAIDDFGTGYSSLNYLKLFPLDCIKIDRSFVRDVNSDPDDARIVEAIIALAHGLRLSVIAEGVETEAQRDFLRRRGCAGMQGYLFSRPLPCEGAAVLLRTPLPWVETEERALSV